MASLVLDAPRLAGEPPEDRWRELDGWRAAAIIGVLIGHFVQVPGFNAGRFGVELFFVLSGLLMAQLLFVKKLRFDHSCSTVCRVSGLRFSSSWLLWFAFSRSLQFMC